VTQFMKPYEHVTTVAEFQQALLRTGREFIHIAARNDRSDEARRRLLRHDGSLQKWGSYVLRPENPDVRGRFMSQSLKGACASHVPVLFVEDVHRWDRDVWNEARYIPTPDKDGFGPLIIHVYGDADWRVESLAQSSRS
jgi:hypothetical protein